jgi:predicted nucleotidyltransferase
MKYGLDDETILSIKEVFSSYSSIENVVIYGSRSKGTYRKGSDIDLTLKGDNSLDLSLLSQVLDDLDELYLPYKIDLSIYDDIDNEQLIDHIRRVGQVFYSARGQT